MQKFEKKIELFEELRDIERMSSQELKEATEKEKLLLEKTLKE